MGIMGAPSKKFTAEVNELRKVTSRTQLQTQLQNILDKHTLVRQFDIQGLLGKSLRIIERINEFSSLCEILRVNLKAIYGAVSRYCTSFMTEVSNAQVDCVFEYSNSILRFHKLIDKFFIRLDKGKKNIENREKIAAISLITDYDKEEDNTNVLRSLTADGCDQLEKILKHLRDWVIADERYEVRLREELRQSMQKQKDMLEAFKKGMRKKGQLTRMAMRRDFKACQIENEGVELSNQRKKLERAIETLQQTEQQLVDEFQRKSCQLRKQESKQNSSLLVNPTLLNEIDSIQRKLSATRRRLKAADLQLLSVESDVVSKSQVKQENIEIKHREITDAKRFDKETFDTEYEIRQLEARIKAIVRIIDLKRNPDVLKKQFYQAQATVNEGKPINEKVNQPVLYESMDTDELMTHVISMVADEIGHHLPDLYQRLQFIPERSLEQRKNDLIQLGCRETTEAPEFSFASLWPGKNGGQAYIVIGTGGTSASKQSNHELRKLALQVLRRWRRFNKNVTVMQLTEALRSINQIRLADSIEAAKIKEMGLPAIHHRARVLASSHI